MLTNTSFEDDQDLIVIRGTLTGPRSVVSVRLVVDTAASSTIVVPEVMDVAGYRARDGERLMAVSSPIGREYGYRARVLRFAALGFELADYEVQSSRRRILARPTAIISQA